MAQGQFFTWKEKIREIYKLVNECILHIEKERLQ